MNFNGKYLLGYQISGQTVGIDINVWETNDLNGNPQNLIILTGDTIPSGYTNITSIENWDIYGLPIANDYLVVKFEIKSMVDIIGWTGLTNNEKDLAIKYYAYTDSCTDTDVIIYLMTNKGLSQQEASLFLITQWHRHHAKVLKACRERWYYVKFIVPIFLSFTDSEDLFKTVENLVYNYTEMGMLGLMVGDKSDGLIDYICSTNGFEGQGLQENNYTLLQGDWPTFISMLSNVLVDGIYDKYPDILLYNE